MNWPEARIIGLERMLVGHQFDDTASSGADGIMWPMSRPAIDPGQPARARYPTAHLKRRNAHESRGEANQGQSGKAVPASEGEVISTRVRRTDKHELELSMNWMQAGESRYMEIVAAG
jgi:hypothetical protein